MKKKSYFIAYEKKKKKKRAPQKQKAKIGFYVCNRHRSWNLGTVVSEPQKDDVEA